MLPMALRTTSLPWVEVREACLAAPMASVVLRATLIDGGLHLVHGGGHLGDLALLAGHALGGLLEMALTSSTRAAELAHRTRDLAHQASQRLPHPVDGRAQLTQLVAVEAVATDPLLQLPCRDRRSRCAGPGGPA